MNQGDNSGYNNGISCPYSDIEHPQNDNNPRNEPDQFLNLLGYDINLNNSYQHNNGGECLFQNNNDFSYLNEGNCQDSSRNIYNQFDEEKMEIEEEINANKDQQDKISEKDFKEGLDKQKEENQSEKFDLKDYCVEKEMQQSGNDLSTSFLDEQFFLNDILFPSDKKQNILYLSDIEGNAENISMDKNKESKTSSKENENNPEGSFKSNGCGIKNPVNLNEFNFLEGKSETEKSIIQEESEQNEIKDNIFNPKIEKEPKHKTEELKDLNKNDKSFFPFGKSFEKKLDSKTSGNILSNLNNFSTETLINFNNSSNKQNANNFDLNDEDSKSNESNNTVNNLNSIEFLSDILKQRKLSETFKYRNKFGSFIFLQDKSFEFALISNKSPNLNNTFSFNTKHDFPKISIDLPKNQLLEMKKDRVRKEIYAHIEKPKKNGDYEKSIHREFRKYLKVGEKYKKITSVSNNFWKEYFKNDVKLMNIMINGKKIKSYSEGLSEYLFKFAGIAEKYEELLKDIKFHEYHIIKVKSQNKSAHFGVDFELYRKNMHKIYCNKYQLSDLYLPKFISNKSF